jgi:hypothetical protein
MWRSDIPIVARKHLRRESTPFSPPSGLAKRLFQESPAQSKFLAALAAFALAEMSSETLDLHGDPELDSDDFAASRDEFDRAARKFFGLLRELITDTAGFTHIAILDD